MGRVSDPVNGSGETVPDLYTGEPPIQSAHNTWKAVDEDLARALGRNVHRAWTGQLFIQTADAHQVTLSAPSAFVANKINKHYIDTIARLWAKHDQVDPPRTVSIVSGPRQAARRAPRLDGERPSLVGVPGSRQTGSGRTAPSLLPPVSDVARKRFTLDNFVVGPSNELAFAVARQVINNPVPQYNPIMLHGVNGMGKTHILHAIEAGVKDRDPDRRVRFVSAEDFVAQFVASVRGSGREGMSAFKASLRDVDLLIIDDVHFIADKSASQEELLHTIISLVGAGRQILIASDRHPDTIEKASDRLKSYLSSGLVCKIGPADYDLRLRILDRLIARRREQGHETLAIPQPARDHLAARMNVTPRDLEGAFNQIVAQSQFLGTPITLETVQETLSDSRYMTGQRLTVDRIQRTVCEAFSISLTDMSSKRRARAVARPRQVAMYLSKKLTKRSLPDIGRRFGGRDHTTVMHAVKRITQLRGDDVTFDAQIRAIEETLKG
ncbi:chromosomal replication initiator protein DnaA [Algimonas porphyrae]|uniref:Chromosomal replication initiator protein DnaA n=1 Tax=Algimonas porphyrae TaxID=1128113 RepID=A0ABQ5V0F9_9PROT|nr:chromosomal replication initiator protein DnaA [Algimonas porphyrae]GLQ21034.1 chromosomal replication initiator protein DnaA [Algimonas porphyrae]